MAFGRRRRTYQPKHDVRWLVAGLGNPGSQYENTPHNVGFRVADALAAALEASWIAKHEGLLAIGPMPGDDGDIALLKPLTYMNLCGRSVKPALASFGIATDCLLAVHDEIDLPFGTLQVKMGGGLAGHNGLRSISESLGTRDFVRLRVGVGRPAPGDRRPVRDWILAPWDQSEGEVRQLADDAADAVRLVLRSGVHVAMNKVNGSGSR